MRNHYFGWLHVIAILGMASLTAVTETRSLSISEQSQFQLESTWKVSVGGPGRPRNIYRLAVCSDGSSYLTQSVGRITRLTGTGDIAFDVPGAAGTVASTCDAGGRLVTANGSEIAAFSADVADILPAGRMPSPFTAKLAATDEGVVALGDDPVRGPALWRLPSAIHADSELEFLAAVPAVSEPQDVTMGHLFWDPHRSRIGYVPAERYELHAFERTGRFLELLVRPDATLRPTRRFGPLGRPGDRVMAFVALPDGRYLSGVVVYDEIAPRYVKEQTSIEVLDASLRSMGPVENWRDFGIPQGVTVDGDVLLMGIGPRGSWITRARLVQGTQPAEPAG